MSFKIMSLFSSLSFLLNRATSVLNPKVSTELPRSLKLKELNLSNEFSLIADTENTTNNIAVYNRYLHFIVEPGNSSNEFYTNKSFDLSTTQKWANFISLFTSISKVSLRTENPYTVPSEVQFSNETYINAEHLLESWWNVFDSRYLRHGWGLTTTLIIAYISILVAGVIGNLLVILVVLLRPQMRTVTNMFIMNLAVADLCVIVFCVPSTLMANIFAPWILGSFMCKAVAFVQGVSVCASAYSLAAISLDRCQAVYRNYERPQGFSQRICIRVVFIIWIVAISLTIPWPIIFEIKVSEYDGLRYCVESWGIEKLGNIYFLLVNLVSFHAIPLLLIFVSNWIIYCHVMHRHVPQNSASSDPIKKMHRYTRHVVLRMLGVVTLTFLLSWLPLYFLVIIIKFSENISESEYNVVGILMPIAQWLASCNSSINPILYAFLNKKFRRMFKSILPTWIPVKAVGKYVGSIRTPSFTASAYTGRSLGRSRTSDYHRNIQNGRRTSHHPSNQITDRFCERTETIAKTTVHIISTIIPATSVFLSGSVKNIFDPAIGDKITTQIVTDL